MATERKYCGRTWEQMNEELDTMCKLEEKLNLTEKEGNAFDVAIQCMTTVMNRMQNNKPIIWDQ